MQPVSTQVFPWVNAFVRDLERLGTDRPLAMAEFEAACGADDLRRIPERCWIHPGGRALETFRPVHLRPAPRIHRLTARWPSSKLCPSINMTGGRGWVAIAMVIFATWNPLRAVLGAFLFGGLNALQFYFQAVGMELIPTCILKMLPYVLTIAVMILVNLGPGRRFGGPAALGVPFSREG